MAKWHITLSDWVRTYVFSPVSRWILRLKPRPAAFITVLLAQQLTMLIIGLWRKGVESINYSLWGL
ncbi:MAG: hypothetical protein Q9P01_20715 [Anaerolineae bacterium]|nr:hypothetical protein [Anaerolineae bacterium]